jgi:thioredoxin 1
MPARNFILALFVVFSFSSCNSQNPHIKDLGPDEFQKAIAKPKAQLVDVRTREEYNGKHIDDAVNIDIDSPDFDKRLNELDKTIPIYFYCLSGKRSSKAGDVAVKEGFDLVYNLKGGITAWLNASKPVITPNGKEPAPGMSFDDYLLRIKNPDKLVLVDFNAVWCGPCKVLKPIVLKTAKKNSDKIDLFEVDVDKNPAVSKAMNVQGIPLLILYKQGKEVWRSLGLIDESTLVDKVKEFTK